MPCGSGLIQSKELVFTDIEFHDTGLLLEALKKCGWQVNASQDLIVARKAGWESKRITFRRQGDGKFLPQTVEEALNDVYAVRKEYNMRVIQKITREMKGSATAPVVTPKGIRVRVRV